MELKNAVAVCLIALFSATLVVLIARSLDAHGAAKLEPKLDAIVAELRAIRQGGGSPATDTAEAAALDKGLIVYYFHGSQRCPTCQAIESQSRETVETDFAEELKSDDLAWKILDYESPSVAELTKRFEIVMPVVVLARMKDGRIDDWRRLDRVWALHGDKTAFRDYLRGQIQEMLVPASKQQTPATAAPSIPFPATPSEPAPELPPQELPLPQ